MVVEGVGTLCSVESGVQTPSRARFPSPSHGKVEKGNLKAPATAADHAFWGVEGAWGWRLRPRPSKGHHWPQHGLYMALHGYNTTATSKMMNWRFGLFAQFFLPKLLKKLSLMFRHSYLAYLLSWRTPSPFCLR
jgi:hypothetical protein